MLSESSEFDLRCPSLYAAPSRERFSTLADHQLFTSAVIRAIENPPPSSRSEESVLRSVLKQLPSFMKRKISLRMRENGYEEYRSRKDLLRKMRAQGIRQYDNEYKQASKRFDRAQRKAMEDLKVVVPKAGSILPRISASGLREQEAQTYKIITALSPVPKPVPGSTSAECLREDQRWSAGPDLKPKDTRLPAIMPHSRFF